MAVNGKTKKINYDSWSKSEFIKEIQKLNKRKKYGLIWDEEKTKEIFEEEIQKKLPVLKEIKKNGIGNVSESSNILIEGDNYHALTVLNYTHKEKIDVIYIDPPYNIGGDFTYNDKRVDKDDAYKHSKWLSFMSKRLRLAKNLLSQKGLIFISIDDNELSHLRLLCDDIFASKNFVGLIPRITKKSGKSSNQMSQNHDYVLVFQKSVENTFRGSKHFDKKYNNEDKFFNQRGFYKLSQTLDYNSLQYSSSLDYEIEIEKELFIPGGVTKEEMLERQKQNPKRDWCWRWSKKMFNFGLKKGFIVIKTNKNRPSRIYTKTYQNAVIKKNNGYQVVTKQRLKKMTTLDLVENRFSNDNAKKQLKSIFHEIVFDYPKPTSLIKKLISETSGEDSIILDFFAGSGTTGHAVLELNKKDCGNRKFILCTNNENNICTDVCHPRLKKVITGYKNFKAERVEGVGGNLKYFKTSFVDSEPTDQNKKIMVEQSTEMLCLKEDCFDLLKNGKQFKIFKNHNEHYLGIIYYYDGIESFKKEVKKLGKKINTYVFSLTDEVNTEDFEDVGSSVALKPVPSAILNVYKRMFAYVHTKRLPGKARK